MHSTLNFEQADPRPVLGSQGNEKLASDERTVREELARLQERQSSGAHDAPSVSLDPQITAFRPAAVNDVRGGGLARPMVRGAVGFLLVVGIVGGAIVWQSSYGHAARRIIAQWTPSLISTSAPAAEKSEAAAEPNSQPAAQTAVADATTQPTTAAAQAAPQDAAPASASLPPEQSQLLQTMARDLADAQQKIAELRTSQEQLARDNATTAEQLKAAQQQIARLTATTKVSEQNLRPKPVAPPPPRRPIAAMTAPVVRQPVAMVPPPPPPQTIAPPPQAPAYPPQASAYPQTMPVPQPQGDPVQMSSAPRPPMPVPQ